MYPPQVSDAVSEGNAQEAAVEMDGVDCDWSRPMGGAIEGQGTVKEIGEATATLGSIALKIRKGELLAICGEVSVAMV